jgi:plastocyanin
VAKKRVAHKRTAKRRWKASRILTWVGLSLLAITIAVLSTLAFTGGGESSPRRVRQTPVVSDEPRVTVAVVDNDFEPKHLTVRTGTEVIWKFEGRAAHDVTDDRGAFASGTLGHGDEFRLTFDEPGTYYYYCTLHHVMQGTLVVRP